MALDGEPEANPYMSSRNFLHKQKFIEDNHNVASLIVGILFQPTAWVSSHVKLP